MTAFLKKRVKPREKLGLTHQEERAVFSGSFAYNPTIMTPAKAGPDDTCAGLSKEAPSAVRQMGLSLSTLK